MDRNHTIDYVELPASDFDATEAFYEKTFGWRFKRFGEDYTCFSHHGSRGGFYRASVMATVAGGSALPVLYGRDLEAAHGAVVANGGKIIKETFAFPGGRRFHFTDPHGNELAVWSDH